MKLDTPKAIIIGSIIIVTGLFFISSYQKQLSYNKCARMMIDSPPSGAKYKQKWWFEKACEWNIYVMNGNWSAFIPDFKK